MADWTQIPDATFDTDRPILGSTHLAIVRNFEAMAEGAAGAPRVLGSAIRHNEIARLDIATAVSAPVSFINLDAHIGLAIVAQGVRGFETSFRAISVQASNNNGSSWTTAFSISAANIQTAFAHIWFGPPQSFYQGLTLTSPPLTQNYIANMFSFVGPANAVRFNVAVSGAEIQNAGDGILAVYGLARERE